MCDDNTVIDTDKYLGAMTRRQFSALAAGTALAAMLPPAVNAQATTAKEVKVKTPAGECDALFVHPAKGSHPAVLM